MNHLDLNLLKCFQVVSERRSISEAARVLHLTQAAVSLQIKRLEDQIGQRLFDRHAKGLYLTQMGKDLIPYARQIEMTTEEIKGHVENQHQEPAGTIRVGSYTTATSYLLSDCVSRFLGQYPKVTVSYTYEETELMLQKLLTHDLDCVVVSDVMKTQSFKVHSFYQDELVFVAAPHFSDIKTSVISPKQLEGVRFLSYPLRFDLCYRKVEQRLGKYLLKSKVIFESISFDTLKQMALRGAGATFMPRYVIQNELDQKKLRVIKIAHYHFPIRFDFVVGKSVSLNSTADALLKAIQKEYN